jgi:leucyl-tRNA synthetase
MPGSAGSSWYFLRYTDPHNQSEPFSKEAQKYWMPVDLYIGGAEHTVGHLLYARFWQKVLFDAGLVSHEEPFMRLIHQGMILGEDGEKMSKSRGNVISPDKVVGECGADALRMYEMFMGPIDRDKPWSQTGIIGIVKFLNRLWTLVHPDEKFTIDESTPALEVQRLTHQTIAKVTNDLETLSFNTAISQMMILLNELVKNSCRSRSVIRPLVQCLAPFAPHFSEELWEKLGENGLISTASWPSYDAALVKASMITIGVQVNGKMRGTLEVEVDSEQAVVEALAKTHSNVEKAMSGVQIKKTIFVKNRIINFIV